ncbi:MAG: HAMP domain-containing sensor histidine kinase [Litorilituus sp.]|jgi:signal transduction histidine kinase|nr:HAMP domain-containing sensor histidine kinase [Litorilituus sp.]
MNSKNKITSSRRLLLISILSATSVVFFLVLFANLQLTFKREKSQLEQNTMIWAKTLAKVSVPYLEQFKPNGPKILKEQIKQLINTPFINYIHIYAYKDNQPIHFYTGVNKSKYYPTIPNKIDHIAQLSTFRYHKNYLEIIIKIEKEEKLYGYLYIQSSLQEFSNYIDKTIYNALLLFLLVIIAFTFLALSIHKRFKQPIAKITGSILQISQSKDFSRRLAECSIIELDILTRNINILLNRSEQSMAIQETIYQQALSKNDRLTDKVNARTDALKESNQELLSTLEKLHQFQGQLVENEKMASLGDMVAGIAHEVNTPIGLGVTASSIMTDNLNEIKEAFENKTLKSSQLRKFLIHGQENLGIIYRNLERAAKLITSFKKVAVDQSNVEQQQFNVKNLLDEVILTLKAKINEEQVKVTLECNEKLIVESKPGPINQILINLILNSILHGFEHRVGGNINISIMYLSEQLLITYKDDGIGINENIKAKIFEPFTTTKRGSGGSGLGLHLVYNLVNQALNGHIDFESTIGHGTKFEITVPVKAISGQ